MLSRTKLLMLLFVCGTFAAEKAGEFPPQPTLKPDNSTTTTSTTTTTTTTPKPTPTTTTSTTTPAPPPPNNTTTTSTTTPAPNTTTTTVAPLTTTLKPTPVPAPTAGEWALNYTNTNRTCLVLKMALQLEFTDKANMTHKMNLQDKAQFKGSCDLKNGTQEGIIFQLDGRGSSLAITIQSNASKFSVVDMRSEINMTAPGANVTDYLHFVHNGTEFNTPLANSYRCLKQQTITLAGETKGVLHISQLQLQAFRNTTGDHFSTALDCEGSSTPDVVPIAVGCVLVALIVMILVGYLYGRRYCQARGYLSM